MTGTAEPPESVRAAASVLGATAVAWESPDFGLSVAERHVVQLDNGMSVFVKGATDADTAVWLRNEHRALSVAGAHFGPEVLAWLDAPERPVLVTADLSGGYWPASTGETIWRPGDIEAVLATLDELRTIDASPALRPIPNWPPPVWDRLVAGGALVEAGLCSAPWLERNGPAIAGADERAVLAEETLVHGDIRSDNLCLLPGGDVRLVDWSHAGIGSRFHDLVLLLPTLRLEGGPSPAEVLSEPVELIARLAGGTVSRAVGPEQMPDWLKDVFRRLAVIELQWLVDVLDLEPIEKRPADL